MGTKAAGENPVVARSTVRLALRQQNLGVLLPVLLHEVNGALNGVTLSAELLARLSPPVAGEGAATGASAATLLQRTRSELGHLQQALKHIERRLMPTVTPKQAARGTALGETLRDVTELLLPAARRARHELRVAENGEGVADAADPQVAVRADELFDLVAGLLIVAIEGAAAPGTLVVSLAAHGPLAQLCVEHGAAGRAGVGLEVHRELLRQAAGHAGGSAEWHQSGSSVRGRLQLPLQAA